jgi:hypothetical protein
MAFNGNNRISSAARLGFERARYELNAFPKENDKDPKQVVDFNFAEKTLYGKVNIQHNPIYPNEEFIVPLSSSNNQSDTILVMNYVSQQYADMEQHFVQACRSSLIPTDDPVLSMLVAKRGYESPKRNYFRYADNLMVTYNDNFLLGKDKTIKNFDDYLIAFHEYMNNMTHVFPITFSGYMRSSQGSIFSSGLAIDISGLSFDDDRPKETLMINSPAFNYYLNIAKNYGFSVNKRHPGVLISDVSSPITLLYRKRFGLSTVDSIFSRQFIKTINEDLLHFTNLLLESYENYTAQYPFNIKHKTCGNKFSTETTYKEGINNINIYYNKILNLYMHVRNIEENKPFKEAQIKNMFKNAIRILKTSETKMLDYIEAQFKSKYYYNDGTLTYHTEKYKTQLDSDK